MSGIDNGNNSLFPKVISLATNLPTQKTSAQEAQEDVQQQAQQKNFAQQADAPASRDASAALTALVLGSSKVATLKPLPKTPSLSSNTVDVLKNADFGRMFEDLASDTLYEEGLLMSDSDRKVLLSAASERFFHQLNGLA